MEPMSCRLEGFGAEITCLDISTRKNTDGREDRGEANVPNDRHAAEMLVNMMTNENVPAAMNGK
jgi:hypothetical protein